MRGGLVAATILGLLVGGDWAGPMPAKADLDRYERTCRTYENRARFLPRDGALDFVTVMADGCAAARRSLRDGAAREQRAAVRYLERLARLRDTIIDMNMTRVFGEGAEPYARPRQADGPLTPLDEVSGTGEILIAHRMGLFAAFEHWRAEAGTLALARPE